MNTRPRIQWNRLHVGLNISWLALTDPLFAQGQGVNLNQTMQLQMQLQRIQQQQQLVARQQQVAALAQQQQQQQQAPYNAAVNGLDRFFNNAAGPGMQRMPTLPNQARPPSSTCSKVLVASNHMATSAEKLQSCR